MRLCVAEREQRGLYFMPALRPFWKNTACACLGFGHILSEALMFPQRTTAWLPRLTHQRARSRWTPTCIGKFTEMSLVPINMRVPKRG